MYMYICVPCTSIYTRTTCISYSMEYCMCAHVLLLAYWALRECCYDLTTCAGIRDYGETHLQYYMCIHLQLDSIYSATYHSTHPERECTHPRAHVHQAAASRSVDGKLKPLQPRQVNQLLTDLWPDRARDIASRAPALAATNQIWKLRTSMISTGGALLLRV